MVFVVCVVCGVYGVCGVCGVCVVCGVGCVVGVVGVTVKKKNAFLPAVGWCLGKKAAPHVRLTFRKRNK